MLKKLLASLVITVTLFSGANAQSSSLSVNNTSNERSIATGFFVTDAGHIVTAYHVIANYKNIQVLVDKRRLIKADILKADEELDLALLKKLNIVMAFCQSIHIKKMLTI